MRENPCTISGYRSLELLGSGGMGEIYRAISVSDGRPVALKIEAVGFEPASEFHARERFLRETRLLETIRHENLPEFFGSGELPDGRLYIAMELLVGRSLTEFSGSSLDTLLPLLLQCAKALQATEAAGIVHRDVSPDNFFVVEVGGRSVVKLIDFGIARDDQAESEDLTRRGSFLGKVEYCSPEQTGFVRNAPPIDFRSDMYSLGLTMFSLVLGRLPFPGGTPMDQLNARLKELPGDALKDIEDQRLRRLLGRMLRLAPSARPNSFGEVVAELLRVQAERTRQLAKGVDRQGRAAKKKRNEKQPRSPVAGNSSAAGQTVLLPLSRWNSAVIAGFLWAAALVMHFLLLAGAAADPGASRSVLLYSALRLPLGLAALVLTVTALTSGGRQSRKAAILEPVKRRAVPHPSCRVAIVGDGENREVLIPPGPDGEPQGTILIGRMPSNGGGSITLKSRSVSRQQARLTRVGASYFLQNLSSTNPTLVNSEEIPSSGRRILSSGDRIQAGDVALTFYLQ